MVIELTIHKSKHGYQLTDGEKSVIVPPEWIIHLGYMLGCGVSDKSTKNTRISHWMKQGGLCFYCKEHTFITMDKSNQSPKLATLEHLVTVKYGGGDGPTVMACWECNQSRGHSSMGFYLRKYHPEKAIELNAEVHHLIKEHRLKNKHNT